MQRQNVKQTQTSPIVEKRHPGVEEAVNELKNRIILLERENIKLREAKLELERKNKSYDSIDVVDVGRDKSDINDKELRDKVRFLENQLEKTEDSLRNCQNLMSDNSKRTLDLNSQIVKLKQEEIVAKKSVDDLQLKLDKKEEVIRRIVEDKDKLLQELNKCRDNLQQLRSQVNLKSNLLDNLDKSKDNLEEKVNDLEMKVRQLERNVSEKERRISEIKSINQSLEEENRNVKLDNGSLRVELEHHKSEVERLSDESRTKTSELVDIRSRVATDTFQILENVKIDFYSYVYSLFDNQYSTQI